MIGTRTDATPARARALEDDPESLARTDPLAFLEMCRDHYHRTIRDYRCVFFKQERIKGRLKPEEQIDVRFRESPFSVHFRWLRNAGLAKEADYIAGRRRDDKGRELALFKPAGLLGVLAPTVLRPIDGPEAKRSSRRRLDQFGFKNTLDLVIRYSRQVVGREDEGYGLHYAGRGTVDGRDTYIFERRLPYTGEGGPFPDRLLIVHINTEHLVPLACVAYADDAGDELLGSYVMKSPRFNVGLTDADFETPALASR